jgi:hypothetical protein
MADQNNPFGPAQTRLFKYILKHPGCSAHQIKDDEFPDKQMKYIYNLIKENIDNGLIEKRELGEGLPHEYRLRINVLGGYIDCLHFVKTGDFKGKYKQGKLPLGTNTPTNNATPRRTNQVNQNPPDSSGPVQQS